MSIWEKLVELGQPINMLWLILGDFNCVKSPTEKQLGVAPTWYELKDFVDCCLSIGLHDALRMGCYYTWYSNSDCNPMWCKLDRVLFNNEWLAVGVHCNSHFSPPGSLSDHLSGIVSILDLLTFKPKPFRFFNMAVTPLEVKQTIFHINDNKAPDPDGYSTCFFKRAWNIVGDLVCTAVMDFFMSGRLFRELNHNIIAFVLKFEHCPTVADYWHISCCNVIYKAIMKIIADRLALVLEHLVNQCQTTFVGGRSITDNIFLAQKMIQQYTRKRIYPLCTINVDLRKAFDSVSWTFLSLVLHSYGFSPLFITWIMDFVSTSLFPVALNGFIHVFFAGVWTVFGSKSFHFRWWSLRKFTAFTGIFFGTLEEHQLLGMKFAIPRINSALVSDIFSHGMWPSLLAYYGTSTAKQTRYGCSGLMVSILKAAQTKNGDSPLLQRGHNNLPRFATELSPHLAYQRRLSSIWRDVLVVMGSRRPKAYEYFRSKTTLVVVSAIWKAFIMSSTHLFCGLDYGEGSLHATAYVLQRVAYARGATLKSSAKYLFMSVHFSDLWSHI
ncbi:UNVERIFIED_CONTAM: hypothetical protein Sradi_7073500 [Sesamum radiatum]|uniref:Reverse transcriptase domain-containing protein n=1 Tax=Sesamum radiatum TaxID=300843 RepID=A0AAW2J6S4_SESRA